MTADRIDAVAQAMADSPNGAWLTLPGPTYLAPQFAAIAVRTLDALAAQPAVTPPTTPHRIVWEHDGDTIFARFHCDAGEWADCRVTCAEDCEQWSGQSDDNRTHETDDPGGTHAMRALSYCNPIEWLDNGDLSPQEMYDGPDAPVDSGPVEFAWDGDGYRWHYAAPVTPPTDTTEADALRAEVERWVDAHAVVTAEVVRLRAESAKATAWHMDALDDLTALADVREAIAQAIEAHCLAAHEAFRGFDSATLVVCWKCAECAALARNGGKPA